MTAVEILSELERQGVRLEVAGDRLRLRPREAVGPELMEALKQRKPEIIRFLAQSQVGANPAVSTKATRPEVNVTPDLPETVFTSRNPLAALARLALDSLPAAGKLSPQERRIILDALEVVVLNWLRTVFQPESAWEATCPKGHAVTAGVFARQLLGWACSGCEMVYPASECRLDVGE